MDGLEERIVELEIRLALQDEMLLSLNDTVAKLRDSLDSQQAQLRLLYRQLQDKAADGRTPTVADEVPPHY